MSERITDKMGTKELIKQAARTPDKTIEAVIAGHRVKIIVLDQLELETEELPRMQKESVWAKLIRGAGEPELSEGSTVTSENYKKYLYGENGIIK